MTPGEAKKGVLVMRCLTAALFCVALGLDVFRLGSALAGPVPTLTAAPANFACSFVSVALVNDTIRCRWDPLLAAPVAAKKYAVEAVASFDLGGAHRAESEEFELGTRETSVDVPVSAFPVDVNRDGVPDTLVTVVLRVKGLAPPGRTVSNQHNPWSATATCVIRTGMCGTGVD